MARLSVMGAALGAKAWLVILTGLVVSSPAAAADTAAGSPAFKRCMKASGGVTASMRACISTEYGLLDRDLNATYRRVMRQLPTAHLRGRLRESQRVWLWRRDYDCNRAVDTSGFRGGTAGDLIYDDCQLTELRERLAWLRKVPANHGYLKKV